MEIPREGMASTLTVAATSLTCKEGDIEANLRKAKDVIAEAAARGAEIVVFPETYLTGFCGKVEGKFRELAEPIPGPSTKVLVDQARKHTIYVAMGLVEAGDAGFAYNSAVFLGPEGIVHVHRKVHLAESSPRTAELCWGLSPGDEFQVFKIRQNWNIGMSICYDTLGFPEGPRVMAIKGMDVLITLTAGGDFSKERFYLVNPTRAIENNVFHIFSNLVGTLSDITFFGGAMIISPGGTFLAKGKVDEEDLIVAKLEAKVLFDWRWYFRALRDRRPSAYQDLVSTKYQHL